MFSVANLMHPFEQRRSHDNMVPIFVDFGSLPNRCPSRRGPCSPLGKRPPTYKCCEIPGMNQSRQTSCPVANVLQHIFEDGISNKQNEQVNRKEKGFEQGGEGNTPQRKRKIDTPSRADDNQSKTQREMDPPKPTMQDIIQQAMSAFMRRDEDQAAGKWQQQVDCRGFESKNIRVKIDSHELLLKAFKKQESENGMRSMSMRKSVPLPENIDKKNIKCKLSSDGFMVIDAPYLENPPKENALDFVNDIMTAMLPGLEQLLRPTDSHCETQQKNGCSDACPDEGEDTFKGLKETNETDKTNSEMNEVKQQQSTKEDASNTDVIENGPEKKESVETDHGSSIVNVENEDTTLTKSGSHDNHNDPSNHTQAYEVESNATEDSFVLLSELQNEESAVANIGETSTNSVEHDTNVNNADADNVQIAESDSDDTETKDVNDHGEDKDNKTSIADDRDNNTTGSSPYNNNDNHRVIFRLEMPSYNPESMQVTFDNTKRLLSVSASKDQTRPGARTSPETTTKTVTVDEDVDVDGLQCFFRDGTLTVTAPIKSTLRTIPINA